MKIETLEMGKRYVATKDSMSGFANIVGMAEENKIEFKNVDIDNVELYKEDDRMFIKLEVKRDSKGNFGYITTPKNEF